MPDIAHLTTSSEPHLIRSEWYVLRHYDGDGVKCNDLVQLVSDVVRVNPRFMRTMCVGKCRPTPVPQTLRNVSGRYI